MILPLFARGAPIAFCPAALVVLAVAGTDTSVLSDSDAGDQDLAAKTEMDLTTAQKEEDKT
jgi:hypothetical protein